MGRIRPGFKDFSVDRWLHINGFNLNRLLSGWDIFIIYFMEVYFRNLFNNNNQSLLVELKIT